MPTSLKDFLVARPELARATSNASAATKERQLTSADIPVVIVQNDDEKRGYGVDALGFVDKFFVPLIESGEFRAAATLGDAYSRLDTFNRAGRLHYHGKQLWIDGKRCEEVFAKWKEEQTNWKVADGSVGNKAYLPGRTIGMVAARFKELGNVHALIEEAEQYGLTVKTDARGQPIGGTLYDLKVDGTAPAGVKLPAGSDGKPNPKANPILNLRDANGEIRRDMQRKLDALRNAPNGGKLIAHWIKEAREHGVNSAGHRITK